MYRPTEQLWVPKVDTPHFPDSTGFCDDKFQQTVTVQGVNHVDFVPPSYFAKPTWTREHTKGTTHTVIFDFFLLITG